MNTKEPSPLERLARRVEEQDDEINTLRIQVASSVHWSQLDVALRLYSGEPAAFYQVLRGLAALLKADERRLMTRGGLGVEPAMDDEGPVDPARDLAAKIVGGGR